MAARRVPRQSSEPSEPTRSVGQRLKAVAILGVLSGAGVFLLISLLPWAATKMGIGALEAADVQDTSAFTVSDLGAFPLMAGAFVAVVVFLKELVD